MDAEVLEKIAKLKSQSKTFKALQKALQVQGDFKSMQQATICAGLAEVCNELAEIVRSSLKTKGR